MCVCGGKWQWSQDVSVISHWKWAPQKRPIHQSKHSFETETGLGVPLGMYAVAVCV